MGNITFRPKNVSNKKFSSIISSVDASSVPSSTLDVDLERLETFNLVWLHQQTDTNEQNQVLQKRLRERLTCLITFNDYKSCEQWLKTRSNDEKFFFIVTEELSKRIVPSIRDLESIIAIYIFGANAEIHQIWTNNFSKIRRVTSEERLLQHIISDQIYFENIEQSKSLQIFEDRLNTVIHDPKTLSVPWYQLFLKILLSPVYIPSSPSATPLINILRQSIHNDTDILNQINEFERTYNEKNAIEWLINNTTLSRFLNKALREENVTILFYFRFFLQDIFEHFKAHRSQDVHVYRKQYMPMSVIEDLRKNQKNYLVCNEFLLTSSEPLQFSPTDKEENQLKKVLIEIDAKNRGEDVSFIFVQKKRRIDNDPYTSGILFMCGSIFQIESLIENTDGIWQLYLSFGKNQNIDLLNTKQQTFEKTKDLLMVANLLDQCNQSAKANLYREHLLREFSHDHKFIQRIRKQLSINANAQLGSLEHVQFVVIDLSTRLGPIASKMFDALLSLTNNSIYIVNDYSAIDMNEIGSKQIILFTSSEYYALQRHYGVSMTYLLEENGNKVNQLGRFSDSEDLIFQMADELIRYYTLEAKDDSKSGNEFSSRKKEQIANQIESELKKVLRTSSKNVEEKCPGVTLVYLKSPNNDIDAITNTHNRLEQFCLSFLIFDNADQCYLNLWPDQHENTVFLLIDVDYRGVVEDVFSTLRNVKQIYFWNSLEDANSYKIFLELIHDLISYYSQLGDKYNQNGDSNNAKDMFIKASELCKLCVELNQQ